MSLRCFFSLSMMFLSFAAIADENVIYESFTDVSIGHVFMSPGQRQQLDMMRLHPERFVESGIQPSAGQPQQAKRPLPAGYIIVGSKRPQYWQDGDFIASGASGERSVTTMAFPGDVKIIRHAVAEKPAEDKANASVSASPETSSDPDTPVTRGVEGTADDDEQ